jgi:asparaginyl-tRNA synthetase
LIPSNRNPHFAALLNESWEDLAFFNQPIEKGLAAKLEGIVGSEFVRIDYGAAIQVLERSNEKFEFPVQWGVDLQSEHERYLTEKHAKKPGPLCPHPHPRSETYGISSSLPVVLRDWMSRCAWAA